MGWLLRNNPWGGARIAGYDVVRVLLGVVLLTAAALKGHQLATGPLRETGLLDSRWFLIGVVEFELFFGLWLLSGLYPRASWCLAITCFSVFAMVTLKKAVSGEASCGCFGLVQTDPRYTLAFDLAVVALLAVSRPYAQSGRSQLDLRRRAALLRPLLVVWFLLAVPSAWVCASSALVESRELSGVGQMFDGADGKSIVVLEPETWIGKEFPLLPYIEELPVRARLGKKGLRELLSEGTQKVLLYHADCPKCQEFMGELSAKGELGSFTCVEVPPFETGASAVVADVTGRLLGDREWFVSTPLVLHLTDGRVTQVSSG